MTTALALQRDSRRVSTAFGLLFATAALGTAAAAVTLPAMALDLAIGQGLSAWAVSLHALSMAVATVVYGRATDLRGPRVPLLVGVVAMALGAVLASVATTFAWMVAARLLQGAGAAAVPTIGMAVISARYGGAIRDAALGRLAALVAASTAGGAFIGGIVQATLGWRAVIALPALGLLMIPVLWSALDGSGTGATFDVAGAVCVTLAGGGLVLLVQSPSSGIEAAGLGLVSMLSGALLVRWCLGRRPDGFLPVGVVTNRLVIRSSIVAASVPLGWLGSQVAVPAILLRRGWEPWQVGLLLLPSVLFAFAMPRLAVSVLGRRGAYATLRLSAMVAGVALCSGAVGALTADRAEAVAGVLLLLGMTLVSVAFGLSQPAVGVAVNRAVPPDERGVALGAASLIMLLGASLGAAVVSGVGWSLGLGWAFALLALAPALAVLLVPTGEAAALETTP